MASEVHMGDVGTAIRLHLLREDGDATSDMDVSAATLTEFIVISPTGRRSVWPAVQVTDGKDGRVQYVVGPDDLDSAGYWKIQAHVMVGGGDWRSNVVRFSVVGNL